MYQERMNPKFPFSRKAIKDAVQSNFPSFVAGMPFAPFLWWKTVFESISDSELKVQQSKVRRYLGLLMVCAVSVIVAAAFGFATAAHHHA
jgi:hypothetical protein